MSWSHFTQKSATIWWIHMQHPPGAHCSIRQLSASSSDYSSWSIVHWCLLTIIIQTAWHVMCNAVGVRVTDSWWIIMNIIVWCALLTAPEARQVPEWAWRHWRRCNSHGWSALSRLSVFVSAKIMFARQLPFLSGRHLSCDDCLEDGSEDHQNCLVLYFVPQFYTVISTHIDTYEQFLQRY